MVEESRGLSHPLESNEGREAVDAKLATYAAIAQINEGLPTLLLGGVENRSIDFGEIVPGEDR
jgi:hypothetical protein